MQIDGEPWMQPPAEVRDTSGLSCSKGGEQLDNSTCFVSIHPLDSSIHPLSNWALVKKRKKRILSDDPILT